MKELSQYEKQANDFLEKTNTDIKIEFLKEGDHFNDGVIRDIYNITIKRGHRKYTFEFGQSVNNSGFYAMQGKSKTVLDRKFIGTAAIHKHVRVNTKMPWVTHVDKLHYPISPTNYDVLACLTKYDVDTFEDFCSEYGYDIDSREVKKTHKAVKKEWQMVQSLWSDVEIEMLQEIN